MGRRRFGRCTDLNIGRGEIGVPAEAVQPAFYPIRSEIACLAQVKNYVRLSVDTGEKMKASEVSATANRTLDDHTNLIDIVTTYGVDAVIARIATLRAGGHQRAAKAIEHELNQLDYLMADADSRTAS